MLSQAALLAVAIPWLMTTDPNNYDVQLSDTDKVFPSRQAYS